MMWRQRVSIRCSLKGGWLALYLLGLVACSSRPTVVKPQVEKSAISAEKQIRLLVPEVTVERLSEKPPRPEEDIKSQDIARQIQGLAVEALQQKGATLTVVESLGAANTPPPTALGGQETFAQRLVRPNLGVTAALELLQEVCRESTTSAVLVHSLHVKIGPKDGVEVYGIPPVLVGVAPKAGMRTSYLRAVLRDCETGELLWRSEVFLRDLPQSSSAVFENSVRDLYQNLTILRDY